MAMLKYLREHLDYRPSRAQGFSTLETAFVAPRWPDYEADDQLTALLAAYKKSSRLSTKKNLALGLPYVSEHKCSGEFTPQRVDKSWIRLDHITAWLRHCDEYHRDHCFDNQMRQSPRAVKTSPKWLIDTEEHCLVAATSDMTYFALSYLWGEEPGTTTTVANLGALQERGGIMRSDIVIPRLIHDIMRLTSLLKNRYLWVDRFCIVQDDEPEKIEQLNNMASIYSHAYATIVVADRTATKQGLYGLHGLTRPRITSSLLDAFVQARNVKSLPDFLKNHLYTQQAQLLLQSDWADRGWTFQEYMFSTRKIVFQSETINWECHCSSWLEVQSITGADTSACNEPTGSIAKSTWPNTYQFARLVSLYNKRLLTFPNDALRAFAGTLTALCPTFPGGFISGIPQMFFDSMLIWQPFYTHERRIEQQSTDKVSSRLPSWSWIGWQGDTDSKSMRSSYDFMRKQEDEFFENDAKEWEPSSWHTTSTVEWSYMPHLDSEATSIALCGHIFRDSSAVGSKVHDDIEDDLRKTAVPRGWTLHGNPLERTFYTHETDEKQTFWYPIPLNIDTDNEKNVSIQAPFLKGRTRLAKLLIGRSFRNNNTSPCLCATLEDCNNIEIGFLRWNFMGLQQKPAGDMSSSTTSSSCTNLSFETQESPRDSDDGCWDFLAKPRSGSLESSTHGSSPKLDGAPKKHSSSLDATYEISSNGDDDVLANRVGQKLNWFPGVKKYVDEDGLVEKGTAVEVIELSAGRASYQKTELVSFDEWDGLPQTKTTDYEFFNVMMIKREGAYVTRVAVGRVERAAWLNQATAMSNIILG